MRADGGERAVEGAHGGGDQRLLCEIAGVGDEIARGKIIGAVGHNIVASDQIEHIAGDEPHVVQLDRHMRVEPADGRGRARDLRHADVGRGVDHLALQIGERDLVVIDDAKRADTGSGEIEQHRRAQPAGADDQHTRALERRLAGSADLAQHDVARIPFQFVRGQLHRCSDPLGSAP